MIAATVLGIFFVPALFVLVRRIFPRGQRKAEEKQEVVAAPAE